MALYLCRWTNGDCSFVFTARKGEAIELLDEIGNAEGWGSHERHECPVPWPVEAPYTASPTNNCAQRRSDVSCRLGWRSIMEIPVTTQEVANGKYS
jgi:hypothetical protein